MGHPAICPGICPGICPDSYTQCCHSGQSRNSTTSTTANHSSTVDSTNMASSRHPTWPLYSLWYWTSCSRCQWQSWLLCNVSLIYIQHSFVYTRWYYLIINYITFILLLIITRIIKKLKNKNIKLPLNFLHLC